MSSKNVATCFGGQTSLIEGLKFEHICHIIWKWPIPFVFLKFTHIWLIYLQYLFECSNIINILLLSSIMLLSFLMLQSKLRLDVSSSLFMNKEQFIWNKLVLLFHLCQHIFMSWVVNETKSDWSFWIWKVTLHFT